MSVLALQGKTNDELLAIIAGMQKASQRKLTLKVSKRGAISLYGMGRYPVTLYRNQWEALLGMGEAVREFIVAHDPLLSTGKDDTRFANVSDERGAIPDDLP